MNPSLGIVLGSILGGGYFALQESGVPRESNCQYLAPWTTDLIAWIIGSGLIYKGYKENDWILSAVGSSLATIHVAQFAANKIIKNRVIPLNNGQIITPRIS